MTDEVVGAGESNMWKIHVHPWICIVCCLLAHSIFIVIVRTQNEICTVNSSLAHAVKARSCGTFAGYAKSVKREYEQMEQHVALFARAITCQ